jgi:hypothetical protein
MSTGKLIGPTVGDREQNTQQNVAECRQNGWAGGDDWAKLRLEGAAVGEAGVNRMPVGDFRLT